MNDNKDMQMVIDYLEEEYDRLEYQEKYLSDKGKKYKSMLFKALVILSNHKQGRWIDNMNGTFTCSECGAKRPNDNYCGNCGAKMEVEE